MNNNEKIIKELEQYKDYPFPLGKLIGDTIDLIKFQEDEIESLHRLVERMEWRQ